MMWLPVHYHYETRQQLDMWGDELHSTWNDVFMCALCNITNSDWLAKLDLQIICPPSGGGNVVGLTWSRAKPIHNIIHKTVHSQYVNSVYWSQTINPPHDFENIVNDKYVLIYKYFEKLKLFWTITLLTDSCCQPDFRIIYFLWYL